MAEINKEKLVKGVLQGVLKEVQRGREDVSAFEKVASAEAAKAREGKGLIGGAIASQRARMQVSREYAIATKGTQGKRQAVFEGLLGRDLGDLFKNLGLEKMESPERIKEARAKFKLDKKEKGDRAGGGVGKLAKPLSLILRNVIQTQKMVRNIEKALTKPSLKSGYTFDPRMAGGGRYKSTATNKIVSAKEATGSAGKAAARTAALTAAIGADEDPLLKLKESVDKQTELIDKIKKDTSTMILSLNGVTPSLGLLSVHDKLNMLLAKSALGGLGDLGGGNRRGRKGPRGRKGGGFRRGGGIGMGGLLAGAAGGFLAYQAVDSLRDPNLVAEDPEVLKQQAMEAKTPEEKKAVGDQITAQKKDIKLQAGATAAGGAGAVAGAVAAKKIGETAVVKNVKSKAWDLFVGFVKKKAPKLFAKIGARLALAGGLATIPGVGWVSAAVTIAGSLWMAYDLYQLWKEFSALSDAEKQLYDEKAEKTKSTGEVKPTAVKETAPAASPVSAATPSALPGGATVAAATTTAAAIPAAVGGAAAPTAPTPPAAEPKTMLQTAVEKAKEIGSGVVTGAKQVATAVKEFFTGPAPKLDQVTTKQNAGVDTSGLQGGMQDRLARMAKAFQEVTGKKLMLTSAFRSDEKQMKLWTAKYNELKAANPNADEAQLTKMTRKWVALPMALGGKGSAHNRGTAVDINSKGAAGIEAINGMTFNGQKVTTDSFLAMFGLKRPLSHEPWHLQPLEGAPTPDNPDPNAKPLVADAKGNMVNLETGKAESVPPAPPMTAQATQSALPPVSDSGGPPPAAVGAEKQEQQTMTASAAASTPAAAESVASASADPLATMADGTAVDSKPMVAQSTPTAPLTPVENTTGTQVAQGSSQLESSKMVAQASPPAPVVVNNNQGGGQQQPITPPKTPMAKASSRSNESAFSRALAKDFSHPSAFTSTVA